MNNRARKQFVKARDAALLSLDRRKIEKFARKWGAPLPSTEEAFWLGVHKARADCLSIPIEARKESVEYLEAKGSVRLDGTPPREALVES